MNIKLLWDIQNAEFNSQTFGLYMHFFVKYYSDIAQNWLATKMYACFLSS